MMIFVVASAGLEPAHPKIIDFESIVSTIPPRGHQNEQVIEKPDYCKELSSKA